MVVVVDERAQAPSDEAVRGGLVDRRQVVGAQPPEHEAVAGRADLGVLANDALVTAGHSWTRSVTLVAIGDRGATVHNPNGIDIEAAITHVRQHRTLEGFQGGSAMDAGDLLTLDVDVLVPFTEGSLVAGTALSSGRHTAKPFERASVRKRSAAACAAPRMCA